MLLARSCIEMTWWMMKQQAKEGFELFDAILDGMEQEEKELLEYEREIEREAAAHSVVSSLKASTGSMTLEGRLEALRLKSASRSQSAHTSVAAAQTPAPASASISASSVLQRESNSARAKSQPTSFRKEKAKVHLPTPCFTPAAYEQKCHLKLILPLH